MPTLLLTLLRPPRPGPPRRDAPDSTHSSPPTEPGTVAVAAMVTCFGTLARLR